MASLMIIVDLFVLGSFLVALSSISDYRRQRGLSYQPGPHRLTLIENLLRVPNNVSWLTYTEVLGAGRYDAGPFPSSCFFLTGKLVGDTLSFHTFGQVIIVLNTTKNTKDLLDTSGDTYSDRPVIQIFEMMKMRWLVPFARYFEFWGQSRKLLDPGFSTGSSDGVSSHATNENAHTPHTAASQPR
ncbi:hypothetical protein EDB83DRAFT_1599715 [Lactarius deliciosus]|nr:hypothetical protein EDB83DRAFT_1599715 [Lactarius deliciosus]